jgi:hypothetical protein
VPPTPAVLPGLLDPQPVAIATVTMPPKIPAARSTVNIPAIAYDSVWPSIVFGSP